VCGVLALVNLLTQPTHASCPHGWHHNGVRVSGDFMCERAPVGDPDQDGVWGRPDHSVVPSGLLPGKVYCTGGAHPIVVNERVVGCQR
jgi:hypothetical protein